MASCNRLPSTEQRLNELGGEPCPHSDFTCVTLETPIDHTNPNDGAIIEVTFAVLPASGAAQGALVIAVGGPGMSGVESADTFAAGLDESIVEAFDLVLFDQRGIGRFNELVCPTTDAAFEDDYALMFGGSADDWNTVAELFASYYPDCVDEFDEPTLASLGTDQAVEDLELFRQTMGYDSLIFYGWSYGTSFAQTYATAHPRAVERLVLDGTIDLSRDAVTLAADQIDAFDTILERVFDACDSDSLCADDMGMPAGQAFQDLLDLLEVEPAQVRYPVGQERWEELAITANDLSDLAFDSAYFEDGRMMFLRSVAAASRGDLIPLTRLLYAEPGNDFSPLLFQAVTCLDFSLPGKTVDEEAETVAVAWEAAEPSDRWLYLHPLTCAFWPYRNREQVPPNPFLGEGIPTLVVSSDSDPVTPHTHGVSVYENLGDGFLLTVKGGSHVMFGRGIACVDDAVTEFILFGLRPEVSSCSVGVTAPYVPLLPEDPDGVDPAELLASLDGELYYLPEIYSWDSHEWLELGCSYGGVVTFLPGDTSTEFDLEGCALTPELVVTGWGYWDHVAGNTHMAVSIKGDCFYTYDRRWEDSKLTLDTSCD